MRIPGKVVPIALLLSICSMYSNVFAQSGNVQSAEELIRLFAPVAGDAGEGEAVRGIAGVRDGRSGTQFSAAQGDASRDQQSDARTQFRNILFGMNSYNIESESYPQLNEIGKALLTITKTYPSVEFVVEGHTDSTGGAERNLMLSRYRADAIVNYLVQRFALDPRRIGVIGYGEQRPIASNDTDRGRDMNRRVEIVRR